MVIRVSHGKGGNTEKYAEIFTYLPYCTYSCALQLLLIDFVQVSTHCKKPVSIYFFRSKNGNTRTMCEICSKLTIKTAEKHQ